MKKNELTKAVLVLLVILGWFAFGIYYDNYYKKVILENYRITTGHITRYTISGDVDNRILTYKYAVDGIYYQRYITPSVYFDECHDNINRCNQLGFHVIYTPTKPQNSLIDLTYQILKEDSIYVTKNLMHFE